MQLVEVDKKGYLILDENNKFVTFQNSRPKYDKWYGINNNRSLYKVNKIYKFNELFDSNTVNYEKYIAKYYSDCKFFVICYSDYNKRYYNYSYRNLSTIDLNYVFIIFLKDCIRITELTPLEKKVFEEEQEKESDTKVIQNLLKDTVDTIVNKYGIKEYNQTGCYYFESQKALNTFIFDALNKTVFEELRLNGFKIHKKSYRGKLGLSSLLFTTYDLGIEKDKKDG